MDTISRHLRIPEGFRVRRPDEADAGAVAELKRTVEMARHGESDETVDLVREEWALPRLDLRRDAWLIEDVEGSLVGYGFCWTEAPPGEIVAEQIVDPGARGLGLSEYLLESCEARAVEVLAAAGPESSGLLGVWSHHTDVARLALFERHGYRRVRTFLRLDRDLGPEIEPPRWPHDIVVRTFRREQDEARVHRAGEEAFRDHFRPTEMDLDEWLRFRFLRDDLDLGLWFVAWEGEEVAGSVLCFETPLGGYVDELFVRRPWRGRGLGRALLLHACAELRRRGLRMAYLGVDAANPTGAMHLYESAGFRSVRGPTYFHEKELNAGRA
jgi:mycothiol synthase